MRETQVVEAEPPSEMPDPAEGLGSKTGPNGALQALAGGFHLFLTNFYFYLFFSNFYFRII